MVWRKNPTHGGGRACYWGHRPKSGTCAPCRATHARQHTTYNRSPAGRAVQKRYRMTAKGLLAQVRYEAKTRGNR